jgi:acyl-coenzyme A synthetase/AMP-(fatty) acid ligase
LRVLLAGGDVVHPEAVVNVLEEIDGLTVINGYGPTENTTFTTCHVMTKDNRPDGTVPIGRPVTGTEVFILDDGRQPVRPGEIGELYVAGLGVALGYLKDDPQHSPYFYDKRFSDGLLYRTGDLVRLNEDSLIEFIGRRDRQVKVRGYRISLEEIRACLIELPEVKEAVVGCRKLASGDQLLLAHLQTEKDRTVSIGTVRTHLRSRLPSYMIPDRISTCTALPLTTSGKVDTKAVISNLNESEG